MPLAWDRDFEYDAIGASGSVLVSCGYVSGQRAAISIPTLLSVRTDYVEISRGHKQESCDTLLLPIKPSIIC
jgi:hypothetical protein